MEITGITTVWDVDQTVHAIADSKNIIVPRYGLAVAKGQYPVAEEVPILKAEPVPEHHLHPARDRLSWALGVTGSSDFFTDRWETGGKLPL